ncbi:MAG: hypothetical protein M1546_21855 [Chloroflexi bacterium]|nr:hypothetical protein [Chloroflexota bacterium]
MRRLDLRSRRGEGYIALTILILPLITLIMALATEGMGLAVTYRRAVGLATVGAQAAGATVQFSGGGTGSASDACAAAVRAVCENAQGCGSAVAVSCVRDGNQVKVTVVLKPLRVFGGPFSLNATRVVGMASSEPMFGINGSE